MGSVVSVSWIAALLSAERRGRLLASWFAFSLPMAVLESTSTQNDLVAAFWLASLLAFALQAKQGKQPWLDKAALEGCVEMGVLTKGAFAVYAAPILAWHFLPKLRRERSSMWLAEGGLVLLLVAL